MRRRLSADGDPRDERIFDDLQRVLMAFRSDNASMSALDPLVMGEISTVVQTLSEACMDRLERQLKLRDTAVGLQTQAIDSLRQAREALITEAASLVAELAKVLAEVQTHGIRRIADTSLASGHVKEQTGRLRDILEGAKAAHDMMSPSARENKHGAFRQRLRAAQQAESSAPGEKDGVKEEDERD
jgi:hypothetical protein